MFKKALIILTIAILIGLSPGLGSIFAQRYYEQKPMVTCENLILIEEKLDKLLVLLKGKGNKEIPDKLDQILANQAQIKDELKIIKVRASR